MIELPTAIPGVEVLLALEPEELGAKMLFLLRKRTEPMFNLATLRGELWSQSLSDRPHSPNRKQKIDLPSPRRWRGWTRINRSSRGHEWSNRLAAFEPAHSSLLFTLFAEHLIGLFVDLGFLAFANTAGFDRLGCARLRIRRVVFIGDGIASARTREFTLGKLVTLLTRQLCHFFNLRFASCLS